MKKLFEISEINPRQSNSIPGNESVSFLPMADVEAETGITTMGTDRPYHEVCKGYTPFLSGDILVAKITPCFENGKIAQAIISNLNGFGSTEFHVIRPLSDAADTRYLLHFLRQKNIRLAGERRMTGSAGQKRVPESFLSDLEIPLPPLPEQRRIAEVLDRVEGLRAKRWESIVATELLAQGIFRELFGDPVRNPMHWTKLPFGEVCDTRLGKMLDQKQQTGENPRPYLRNANVQWFRFDLDEVFEMDFDEKARDIHVLKKGDLLICEGGEPGRCAVWNGEIPECYFQKALHRARPDESLCNSVYLSWLLWFLSKGSGLNDFVTSATIAHLTGEKLKAMPIPVPPISIQQEFARRIASVENLKGTHRASLAQLDALFASLQHRAFRGEL